MSFLRFLVTSAVVTLSHHINKKMRVGRALSLGSATAAAASAAGVLRILFIGAAVAVVHAVSPELLDDHKHRGNGNGGGGPGRHDCASPELTDSDRARADANMIKTFGKIGDDLSKLDLSAVVKGVAARKHNDGMVMVMGEDAIASKENEGDVAVDEADLWSRNLQLFNPTYSLVNLPIVYHVLTGQYIPKSNATLNAIRPSATAKQLAFMTEQTNKLYNINDKVSKQSVQWASFVHNQTIYHNNYIFAKDCSSLSDYTSIVTKAPEWQFKLHAIICESTQWSGVAWYPNAFAITDVKHNVVRLEYRAVACYNDKKEFLCAQTNGKNISHTRWWRTRSTVLAHEFG